jgi:hypothetical protein
MLRRSNGAIIAQAPCEDNEQKKHTQVRVPFFSCLQFDSTFRAVAGLFRSREAKRIDELDLDRHIFVRRFLVASTLDDDSVRQHAIVWARDDAQLRETTWREANDFFHDHHISDTTMLSFSTAVCD